MTDPNGWLTKAVQTNIAKPYEPAARRYNESEVAAREAAAAAAMREACLAALHEQEKRIDATPATLMLGLHYIFKRLPIPARDALAHALAEAEQRGMEQAAEIARAKGKGWFGNRAVTAQEAADSIADAIRAAAKEIG